MTLSSTPSSRIRRIYDRNARFYDVCEWPVERLLYRRWRARLWREGAGPEVLAAQRRQARLRYAPSVRAMKGV